MSMAKIAAKREALRKLEKRLYDASSNLSAEERFNLSMRVGAERAALAALLKIEGWSADAALDSPEES